MIACIILTLRRNQCVRHAMLSRMRAMVRFVWIKKYLCTPSTTPERKGYSDLEKEEITKPKAALVRIILSKIKVTCGHDIIDAKVLHRIFSQMRTRVTRNLEGDL